MTAVRKTNTSSQQSSHQDIVPYWSRAYLTIFEWEHRAASADSLHQVLQQTASLWITQLSLHHAQLQNTWPNQLSPPQCDMRFPSPVWQKLSFIKILYIYFSMCFSTSFSNSSPSSSHLVSMWHRCQTWRIFFSHPLTLFYVVRMRFFTLIYQLNVTFSPCPSNRRTTYCIPLENWAPWTHSFLSIISLGERFTSSKHLRGFF